MVGIGWRFWSDRACIVGVAEASKDANASFHLLGRSVLIEQTAEWLDWGEEDLMKEKMALRERLADASSNGKVTMVEWNNAWQKFTRSMDVYKTLSQIESTGNRAFYHSIDVTDVEALSSLGASLSNPITGVVHGAGLEDSKLVSDKAWETFDKVVRVKIDGWSALMGAVRASDGELRFASVFTSVAGRFGNGGQTDYAAANSILDAEMARLTAKGSCLLLQLDGQVGEMLEWQRVAASKLSLRLLVSRRYLLISVYKSLLMRLFEEESVESSLVARLE